MEDGDWMLHGLDILGSIANILGIYGITKAVQLVAEYGVETYLPWYERRILD